MLENIDLLTFVLNLLRVLTVVLASAVAFHACKYSKKRKIYKGFAYMAAAVSFEWLIFYALIVLRAIGIIEFQSTILNAVVLFISAQSLIFVLSFLRFVGAVNE